MKKVLMVFHEDKCVDGKLAFHANVVCEVGEASVQRWINRGALVAPSEAKLGQKATIVVENAGEAAEKRFVQLEKIVEEEKSEDKQEDKAEQKNGKKK